MDDGVDVVFREHALACLTVEDGSFDELQLLFACVAQLADAIDGNEA